MSRLNLRRKPRISYYEPEEPNLDEYVFCDKCGDYVYEYCAIHGPLLVIPDNKIPVKSMFPSYVPRAALTIPNVFLHIAPSIIPGAGLGVFTTLTLPRGVRFGPYRGLRTNEVDSMYCWQIYDGNNKRSHVVDAKDANKSNWMRYVNCSRHWREQNLVAYQYQGELYYRTIKIIPRFTELMVFYGSEFANTLNDDLRTYNSPPGYAQKFGTPAPKKQKLDSKNEKPKMFETKIPNLSFKTDKQKRKKKNVKNKPSIVKVSNKKLKKTVNVDLEIPLNNNKISSQKEESQKIKVLLECNECGQKFNSKNALCKHIAVQTKNVYFKCTECTYQNLTRDVLDKHMRFHDKNRAFVCSYCSYRFKTVSLLKMHKLSHRETLHNCDICEFKSLSENLMECHLLEHAGDICRKESEQIIENAVDLEVKVHAGKKQYVCDICQYKCTQTSSLKAHMRIHTGEKPYVCNICQYKCTNSGNLKSHMRIHTGEKPYVCNICQYKCTNSGNLKSHMRIHTGEKPYVCNICQYKCTHKRSLKAHMAIHTGEKPYLCNICQYKFTRKDSLKAHMRIHNGEKPYVCNICQYKCTRKRSLKAHMAIHTGEKPYVCNICQYKFTRKDNLKAHMRIHSVEKPYVCNICQYKCTQSSNLKAHMRTHSAEKITFP